MARGLKSNHDISYASSTGSHHGTISDDSIDVGFHPDADGVEQSTQRNNYDFSTQLPSGRNLRDTARKYGQWNGHVNNNTDSQQSFLLNTSAIGRSFPDFTSGPMSDESTMSEFSVENGRGGPGAKPRQRVVSSRINKAEYNDQVTSPAGVNMGDFKVMNSPQLSSRTINKATPSKAAPKPTRQDSLRRNLVHSFSRTPQKENVAPRVPTSSGKAERSYLSGAMYDRNGEQMRTRAYLQPDIADGNDSTFMSNGREPTVTFPTKTKQSRFTQSPLTNKVRSANASPKDVPGNTATNQSFLLPNMDNLSELVSGSLRRPTGNTPAGKGRFSGNGKGSSKPDHVGITSVPVPEEEKAIFASLQLLEEKCDNLQREKANFQRQMEELQELNYKLESEINQTKKHRRSDSALGDSGSDGERGRLLTVEKIRLEAQVKSQSVRIAEQERTIRNNELLIRNISDECKTAVAQLSAAADNEEMLRAKIQDLENTNHLLQKDNQELLNQVDELGDENDQLRHNQSKLTERMDAQAKHAEMKENEFREQLKGIEVTQNFELADENQKLRKQLNETLNRERARNDEYENQTRQFNLQKDEKKDLLSKLQKEQAEKEALIKKLEQEVATRTQMVENTTRKFNFEKDELRGRVDQESKEKEELRERLHKNLMETDNLRVKIQENAREKEAIQARLNRETTSRIELENNTHRNQGRSEAQIRKEVAREFEVREGELRDKLERRKRSLDVMRELTTELKQSKLPFARPRNGTDYTRTRTISKPQPQVQRSQSDDSRVLPRNISINFNLGDFDNTKASNNFNAEVEAEESDGDSFEGEATRTIHKDINVTTLNYDNTSNSNFTAVAEQQMAELELEVAYLRFREAEIEAGNPDPAEQRDDTMMSRASARSVRSVRSSRSMGNLRRPSQKATAAVGILKNARVEDDNTRQSIREDTMRSQISNRSRRHSIPFVKNATTPAVTVADITSVFLIPDITLGGATGERKVLSEKAKKVLNKLCAHDSDNCFVCTRVASFGPSSSSSSASDVKKSVTISKPVPVSERMPVAVAGEQEPTLRPSVAPGQALATVLKGLQDELAHLKVQYSHLTALYNKLDFSLGMSKRKALKGQMDQVGKAIDVKGDQIYALYDVLEGQKQSGQEMDVSELEVTLQRLNLGGAMEEKKNSGEATDEELPWEGIETTNEELGGP